MSAISPPSPGDSVRVVDSRNFPVSELISAALVEILPGAIREMHWHPNNDSSNTF
ncbi:cupin domain-containing protein [Psychrobacillus psychrotolerans]|uniref:cupin domain-containing protein n=1 Tax=Psychrobacillus psychrotolerans TaxID=126156 RepID=UPI0033146358